MAAILKNGRHFEFFGQTYAFFIISDQCFEHFKDLDKKKYVYNNVHIYIKPYYYNSEWRPFYKMAAILSVFDECDSFISWLANLYNIL